MIYAKMEETGVEKKRDDEKAIPSRNHHHGTCLIKHFMLWYSYLARVNILFLPIYLIWKGPAAIDILEVLVI